MIVNLTLTLEEIQILVMYAEIAPKDQGGVYAVNTITSKISAAINQQQGEQDRQDGKVSES